MDSIAQYYLDAMSKDLEARNRGCLSKTVISNNWVNVKKAVEVSNHYLKTSHNIC